ncbi:uncharacterized protein LOC115124226 isoform X2 [Oncorhynchus nerka]
MEEESQDCVRVSDSSAEAMEELSITECRVVDQSLCTTDPPMKSLDNFEAEIYDHEGKGAYRFQCPSAGLFQCSITGLVFRMEGEGEVLYRTVHWDMRLLSQNGKRPAGPCSTSTVLRSLSVNYTSHTVRFILTAEFLDFQSYENYFPTFQLFLLTVVKEFDLLLKENGSTENQWERHVWLPAPVQVQPHGPVAPVPAASAQPHGPAVPIQLQAVPTLHQPAPQPAGPAQVQPHGPVAPVPAGPAQVQPHGPAAPTAVVRPSVRED